MIVKGGVTLENIPEIDDVRSMIEILEGIGVTVVWEKANTLFIDSDNIDLSSRIDPRVASRICGSILFVAPLLHRLGKVDLPFPGGDRIGRRRIDKPHLQVIRALGAEINIHEKHISFSCKEFLEGKDMWLDEASVTGTEQAIIGAVMASGKTTIRNAAFGASCAGPSANFLFPAAP